MAGLVSGVVMQPAEHTGLCCFQRGRTGRQGQRVDLPHPFTQPEGGLLMSGKVEQTRLIRDFVGWLLFNQRRECDGKTR